MPFSCILNYSNYKRFFSRFKIYNFIKKNLNYHTSTKSETLTLKKDPLKNFAKSFLTGIEQVHEITKYNGQFREYIRDEYNFTEIVVDIQQYYLQLDELQELHSLAESTDDVEMKKLALLDAEDLDNKLNEKEDKILWSFPSNESVLPDRCLLELNAAVGGEEAFIFAAEMLDMYRKFGAERSWDMGVVEQIGMNSFGGFRRVSLLVEGEGVGKLLACEGGVHRVQRVPRTEKNGRVHTSTVAVAVLPQYKQEDLNIPSKDLKYEYFKSSGPGGQCANKSSNVVRATHLPSGLAVVCSQERTQQKNKAIALSLLLARLYDRKDSAECERISRMKKAQLGSKSYNERIRTYNFPQDRVTDHRISSTIHNISDFMNGGTTMESILWELAIYQRNTAIEQLLQRFVKDRNTTKRKEAND